MAARYHLRIAGLAIDVHAPADVDTGIFDDRARRYARPVDGSASAFETLELHPRHGQPLPEGHVCVEGAGCSVAMSEGIGRTVAYLDPTLPAYALENTLRILVSRRALQAGGVVLHAAALCEDDVGVAFPGVSGAGKSTLTLRHPDPMRVSEDLVAVVPDANGWRMEALPFIAQHQLDLGPKSARLTGLAFPFHAAETSLVPLTREQTLVRLARTVVCFEPTALRPLLLERLTRLSRELPACALGLDLTTPFWPRIRGFFDKGLPS